MGKRRAAVARLELELVEFGWWYCLLGGMREKRKRGSAKKMETLSFRGSGYDLRSKGSGSGYNLRSTSSCSRDTLSSKSKVKKLKSPNKTGASNTSTPSKKRKDDFEEEMALFANLALQQYNSEMHVKNGCTGAAFIPPIGLVRHLDFEAKDQDEPHAPLKTFFAEVITARIEDHRVSVCKCLGPSVSLPKYSDNHGCMMCWPGGLHHPSDGNFLGK